METIAEKKAERETRIINVNLTQPVKIQRIEEARPGFTKDVKNFMNCGDIHKLKKVKTEYSTVQAQLVSYALGKFVKKHCRLLERQNQSNNESDVISRIRSYDGIKYDDCYGLWQDIIFLTFKDGVRFTLFVNLEHSYMGKPCMEIILREEDLTYYRVFIKLIQEEISMIKGYMFKGTGEMVSFERNYGWDSIMLPKDVLAVIKHNIVDFFASKDLYYRNGVFKRGIILYGEPGNGKTLLCKVLASQLDCSCVWVTPKDLSDHEASIKDVFNLARMLKPTLIFLEDLDLVAPVRHYAFSHEKLGELLSQLDGIANDNNGIITIATTNAIKILDKAIGRAGRFDIKLEIRSPSYELRLKILEKETGPLTLDNDVSLERIAELSDGFSGAQVKEIITKAAIEAIPCRPDNGTGELKIKMENLINAVTLTMEMKKNIVGFKNK